MAFGPLARYMRLLSTIWFNLGHWAWSWIASLPRLISGPLVGDVETGGSQVNPGDGCSDEPAPKVVYTATRDAQGELISGGITGIVELLDDGTALKAPFPGEEIENHIQDIAKEASIYHRIGPHPRLVRMLGHSREGLVLEYMKNGDLKTYLQTHESDSIPTSLKLKWACQVAEAVDLLHRNGVIHSDIKPRNLLLDAAFDVKIIDFSGSSLDGSKPTSGEGTRFYLPRHWREQPTVATDLFALGSTLYAIFQGVSPYEELPSDEVERLFTRKEFPDISGIPCGQVIKQCWLSQLDTAADVRAAIQDVISHTVNADCIPHHDALGTPGDTSISPSASP